MINTYKRNINQQNTLNLTNTILYILNNMNLSQQNMMILLNDTWTITFSGTEYATGQNATTTLQILSGTGIPITNAQCTITTYDPNKIPIATTNTTHLTNGIYYYDFQAQNTEGIYIELANCTTTTPPKNIIGMHTYHVNPSLNLIQNIIQSLTQIISTMLGINQTITTINNTTIQNQQILNQLLNQTNTNPTPTTIIATTTNCITGSTWRINAQVLDQYNNNYPTANCNINTTQFGNQPMTYNPNTTYRDWETDRKSTRLNSSHRL